MAFELEGEGGAVIALGPAALPLQAARVLPPPPPPPPPAAEEGECVGLC